MVLCGAVVVEKSAEYELLLSVWQVGQPLKVLYDKKGRCSEEGFQLKLAEKDGLSSVQYLPISD